MVVIFRSNTPSKHKLTFWNTGLKRGNEIDKSKHIWLEGLKHKTRALSSPLDYLKLKNEGGFGWYKGAEDLSSEVSITLM